MNRRQFIKSVFGACTGLAVLPVVGKAGVTHCLEDINGIMTATEIQNRVAEKMGRMQSLRNNFEDEWEKVFEQFAPKEFIGISEYPYCEC